MVNFEKHLYTIWLYMAAIHTPSFVRQAELDAVREQVAAKERYGE